MNNKNFSYYLSKYLREYLIIERNFSQKTVKSYKVTFQILIDFLVKKKDFKIKDITFQNVTQEIIIDFLNYLEIDRKNSIRTRNHRLSVIKSFYKYCSIYEVDNIDNINKILMIKDKKTLKGIVEYLTESELKDLFNSIDGSTKLGKRDLVLLSLLYDTAARANEIINLRCNDINLENKTIILNGKGNKKRYVCIMEETKQLLLKYIDIFNINSDDYLFNNKKKKQSESFVRDVIRKYKNIIPHKHIHPHIFRHTRAVHLLDHGVNIVYIQEFLGHSDVTTTQIYATVIEKTKFEAIKTASEKYSDNNLTDWNDDQDLLSQLINL